MFGEQSMKALRCERIEDLIYISADAQNDANLAEVSITIDNEDFFPQFGAEFEIRRRFFRTGDSEFYLNRVKCRLQDIQALFLNSGTLTYSFLELGEIERIIHGETKEMFDDVSGILKYQERREQTQRRLEVTEQDLLRLEDIIHEMQRSLRGLKRQVRQTRLFQELREEFRMLSLYLLKKNFQDCNAEMIGLQEQLLKKENEKQAITQQIKTHEEERESLKNEMSVYEIRKKEIIERLNAINNQIVQLEQKIEEEKEKGNQIKLSKERMITSIHEKEEVLKANAKRLSEYQQQIATIEESFRRVRQNVDQGIRQIEEINQRYFQIQEELKRKSSVQEDLKKQISDLNPETAKLRFEKENKEALLEKLNEEYNLQKNEIDKFRRSVKEAEENLDRTIGRQEELSKVLNTLSDALKTHANELQNVEADMELRRGAYNDCKLQIDTISQRLREKGAIKEIADKVGNQYYKLMRDHIKVESGYETIVDICLGDILHYYVVEDLSIGSVKDLPDGRHGFLNIMCKMNPEGPPEITKDIKAVKDFVKIKDFKDTLSYYINRYFIVNGFDQAKGLSSQYPRLGFVTPDGILFHEGAIVVERGDVGYFRMSQSLEEQKKQLETIKNEIGFCENEKNRLNKEIEKTSAEIEAKKSELFTINVEKSECSLKMNEVKRTQERILKDHEGLESERYSLRKSIESCASQIQELDRHSVSLRSKMQADLESQKSLELNAGVLQEKLEQYNSELNENRIITAGLEERQTNIKTSASHLHEDIEKITKELDFLKQDETAKKLMQVEDTIRQLNEEYIQRKRERGEIETKMPEAMLEELTSRLNNVFDDLSKKQKAYENIQNEIMQLKYTGFQLEHRKEDAVNRAKEEFKVQLADFAIEEDILDAEVRMNDVKGKLEKLGEVNPLSLELYENEKKRLDEYLGQRDDIITAKRSLLNSIAELDTRAKERFFDIFERVKKEFDYVFSNFFEGGQADLILSDPNNPLTSKVDIVVRMKGKRPKKITQLSGGERTLLAISLLLAFYLVKPAPFCILDEIDAPLDDANVVRFNRFLRDLSQRTQVIIITHNRATMEYADYIYGLTMEKPGQSKIISARLADLEKLDSI